MNWIPPIIMSRGIFIFSTKRKKNTQGSTGKQESSQKAMSCGTFSLRLPILRRAGTASLHLITRGRGRGRGQGGKGAEAQGRGQGGEGAEAQGRDRRSWGGGARDADQPKSRRGASEMVQTAKIVGLPARVVRTALSDYNSSEVC
jgi:hypothetical protein